MKELTRQEKQKIDDNFNADNLHPRSIFSIQKSLNNSHRILLDGKYRSFESKISDGLYELHDVSIDMIENKENIGELKTERYFKLAVFLQEQMQQIADDANKILNALKQLNDLKPKGY